MKLICTFFLLLIANLSYSQTFEVYVSDAGNFNAPPWQILKFDGSGQNPSTFINTNLNWPQDILFLEDSNTVLISNLGSNKITRHNLTTGVYMSDFATGISGPTRTKIGPDSLLYVLQWSGDGLVKRYNLDGSFVDDFTDVGVPQSIGLDWDAEGNLYVSSWGGDFVWKFDSAGNDLGAFVTTNLLGPTNIWFDSDGDLLVSDYNGTAVKRFDTAGVYVSDFITGLSNSEGVDFFPNGNILIGNGASASVKMYDSQGTFIQEFVASGAGNLLTPNAVRIREATPLSVPEVEEQETGFITPSVGSEFFVDAGMISRIKRLSVYDMSGKVMAEIRDLNWQPTSYANGMYFVVADFYDGSVLTQKILLQK